MQPNNVKLWQNVKISTQLVQNAFMQLNNWCQDIVAWRWRWHNEYGDGKPDFACMVGLKKWTKQTFTQRVLHMDLQSAIVEPFGALWIDMSLDLFSTSLGFMKNKGMRYKENRIQLAYYEELTFIF